MKKTMLVMIATLVAGTVASVAYVNNVRDKKAAEMGYTRTENGRYIKEYRHTDIAGIGSAVASDSCNQLSFDIASTDAAQKASKVMFGVCLVVGTVCTIIDKKIS